MESHYNKLPILKMYFKFAPIAATCNTPTSLISQHRRATHSVVHHHMLQHRALLLHISGNNNKTPPTLPSTFSSSAAAGEKQLREEAHWQHRSAEAITIRLLMKEGLRQDLFRHVSKEAVQKQLIILAAAAAAAVLEVRIFQTAGAV
jgi:hypothetical protein